MLKVVKNFKQSKRKACAVYAGRAQRRLEVTGCVHAGKKIMRVGKQTLTDSNIPTFNSFPKTVLSPSAEQFQRRFLN